VTSVSARPATTATTRPASPTPIVRIRRDRSLPFDQNCNLASGHGQRGCTSDADCGAALNSCEPALRHCFLTGGGTFQAAGQYDGTNTLIAVGMEDPPMNDVLNPTLGAVSGIAPTGSSSVNSVVGLPGPGRVTIRFTAQGLP
jgi:hypothetical protein